MMLLYNFSVIGFIYASVYYIILGVISGFILIVIVSKRVRTWIKHFYYYIINKDIEIVNLNLIINYENFNMEYYANLKKNFEENGFVMVIHTPKEYDINNKNSYAITIDENIANYDPDSYSKFYSVTIKVNNSNFSYRSGINTLQTELSKLIDILSGLGNREGYYINFGVKNNVESIYIIDSLNIADEARKHIKLAPL